MPLQTSSHTLPLHNALQFSTLRSYYCPNSQRASQLPTSIPTSLKLCQLGITMVIIITFELGTSLPIFLYKPPQLGQYWRIHNYALPSFEVLTSNQSDQSTCQHFG